MYYSDYYKYDIKLIHILPWFSVETFKNNPSGSFHFWLSFPCNLSVEIPQGRQATSQSWVIHLGNSGRQVGNVLQSGIQLHWLLETISRSPHLLKKEFILQICRGLTHRMPRSPAGSFLLESTSLQQPPEAPLFCLSHPCVAL